MKNYTDFLYERKAHKLTTQDNQELQDFLDYVKVNMDEEPNLLRAAYARIQKILKEIRSGNCPKDKLSSFFQTIFSFIEGYDKRIDDLRKWGEKLLSIDPEEYDTLLSIIHEYNQLVNKFKSKGNGAFNIRAWAFELEGIEPIKESHEDNDNIQRLFMSQELTNDEKQELKFKLPRISIKDIDDDRDWKPGDIMFDGAKELHFLVTENYEDYCDFGCGYIATYLAENPDIDEDEFGEYVTQHNKADRDMGELQDVCKEEIERLGKEFKKEKK